ncbi:MAG: hypothetical protein NT067_03545 [Candidatus Diapherotrites archaeon]|nr:hypothetical protein [Candidatus Diapherotrites archaeon]
MKASIYPDTTLSSLPAGIESVHFARPPGRKQLVAVLEKFPAVKEVSMSSSSQKRASPKAKAFLQEKGISLKIAEERGRAISMPLEKMRNAIEMRRDFRPLREIETATGIPKSTVHYLVKYSQRKKVKNGRNVIYLK